MIEEPHREAQSRAGSPLDGLQFEASRLTPAERFARAGHHPAAIWLTARQELAYVLERKLFDRGCHVHVVAEEVESHIVPELAALLHAAGLISIFTGSAPDEEELQRARALVGEAHFLHVEPERLAASDQRAAEQICALLEERGILAGGMFGESEGI
jgi:adenylylsulfate kinase-like enzyme